MGLSGASRFLDGPEPAVSEVVAFLRTRVALYGDWMELGRGLTLHRRPIQGRWWRSRRRDRARLTLHDVVADRQRRIRSGGTSAATVLCGYRDGLSIPPCHACGAASLHLCVETPIFGAST